ncbi:MAG TPA: GspMb/PilO family protein [Phycisphaerae bacterium]|nr:GspMb/PilO family protein [Phycisphaerae bacterium]
MKPHWQTHAIGGSILAAVALAAWLLLLHPIASARTGYAQLVQSMQADHAQLDQARAQETSGRQTAEAAAASLAARPLMLQPPDAVNTRLQALTDLATSKGVRIDTIEAGRPDDFPQYSVILIQITARSRFADLQSFFTALHERMPDLEVATLELSGRSIDASTGQGVQLKLRWHTAPAPP